MGPLQGGAPVGVPQASGPEPLGGEQNTAAYVPGGEGPGHIRTYIWVPPQAWLPLP